MDEILKQVIIGFPSFAGLLLMLFWQQKRIDQLLERQNDLLDKLERCYSQIARQEETD